jgi:heme/copper-type cytochrome/quinol oxidase subunit 2
LIRLLLAYWAIVMPLFIGVVYALARHRHRQKQRETRQRREEKKRLAMIAKITGGFLDKRKAKRRARRYGGP